MGTVPGSPPGSYRPLAGTMGCSTWHAPPTPEYLLCFLVWGTLFVPTSATDGAGRLLAHLQTRGPHTQIHMQGPSARQGQHTLQVWVQVLPPSLSVAPCLLGAQRQMRGLANSHPVPQLRLHEHGASSVQSRGMADTHLSHHLPLLSQAALVDHKGGDMEGGAGQGRGRPPPSEGAAHWAGMDPTPCGLWQPAKRQR